MKGIVLKGRLFVLIVSFFANIESLQADSIIRWKCYTRASAENPTVSLIYKIADIDHDHPFYGFLEDDSNGQRLVTVEFKGKRHSPINAFLPKRTRPTLTITKKQHLYGFVKGNLEGIVPLVCESLRLNE